MPPNTSPLQPPLPPPGPAPMPEPMPGPLPPPSAGPLEPRAQVVERLKQANTVLVTVSANPTVDQLAACIGMTLLLNKAGKHATAIFSGKVPSTIEFLQPGKTLEQNTDSLQDFIIALDKSKADKLRYKVEDDVVRIFITPYHAALSKDDLQFSHGDFNVEVVLALGVLKREDLDQVILAHGRILHDATVIGVTNGSKRSGLGAINWQEQAASSLCEMSTVVGSLLGTGLIDNQTATAFLTGIVAETERFRNDKTTPQVMTVSAQLMAAGANQQLIANKLEQQVETVLKPRVSHPEAPQAQAVMINAPAAAKPDEGVLSIDHENEIEITEAGRLKKLREEQLAAEAAMAGGMPSSILPEPATTPLVDSAQEEVETAETEEPAENEAEETEVEEPKPEEPPAQPESGKEPDEPKPEQPEPEETKAEEPEAPEEKPQAEKSTSALPDEPDKPHVEPEIVGHNLLSGDVPDVGLTANTIPDFEQPDPSTDPLSAKDRKDHPILSHNKRKDHHKTIEPPAKNHDFEDAVAEDAGDKLPDNLKPLSAPVIPEEDDINKLIGSTHEVKEVKSPTEPAGLDEQKEREKVEKIKESTPDAMPTALKGLGSAPLGEPLRPSEPADASPPTPVVLDPTAPPTAPPPLMPMPQFFDPSGQVDNPYLNPDDSPKPLK